MAHDHNHDDDHGRGHGHEGHSHGVSGDADLGKLAIALGLILGFMAVEVTAGILASSLALLSDAAHMLTDATAIGLSLVAIRLVQRPAKGAMTFGLKRTEILSAQFNGATLLVLGLLIVSEGIGRLITPPNVTGGVVLVVALVGIVFNLAATWTLSKANRQSLNVEGAYQHILTDLIAFIVTAIAGAVILITGFDRADGIASLVVAAVMLHAAYGLLKASGRVFLEAAPQGVDPDAIGRALVTEPGVTEVMTCTCGRSPPVFPRSPHTSSSAPRTTVTRPAGASKRCCTTSSRLSTPRCRSTTKVASCSTSSCLSSANAPPADATRRVRRVATKRMLIRRGLALEYVTLGWNVIGTVVSITAAVVAGSVALAGFGLDSLIEIGASTVVIWQLGGQDPTRERRALRLIGSAFIALAIYIAAQAIYTLATATHPHSSPLGIAWTAATTAVMLALATAKTRTGKALPSRVLQTEGRVTLIDAYLAAAVLLGLALSATIGWWWADPLGGMVIVFYGLREGHKALREA